MPKLATTYLGQQLLRFAQRQTQIGDLTKTLPPVTGAHTWQHMPVDADLATGGHIGAFQRHLDDGDGGSGDLHANTEARKLSSSALVRAGSSNCGKWPVSSMTSIRADGTAPRNISRYGVVCPACSDFRSRFSFV